MKIITLIVMLLAIVTLAGCRMNPASPPPASVAGTVQDISYGHQFGVGNVWTAQLTPDSGSYDGAPNVNLSNDGTDGCIFTG